MKFSLRYSILYNAYIYCMFKGNRVAKEIQYQYNKKIHQYKNKRVLTRVNHQWLLCPFSHKLAIYQKKFPKYDKQLSRICRYIVVAQHRKLNIIDVGANIGDSVINIGIKDAYYLLIEGNSDYNVYIYDNLEKRYNYNLEKVFLTDTVNNQYNITSELGTGRLVSAGNEVIQNNKFFKLDDITRKYKNIHFDILKIDTDGFDFKVLRGSTVLLQKDRPYIFFEWDKFFLREQNENPLSIFSFLKKMGYTTIYVFDNIGNYITTVDISQTQTLQCLIENTHKQGCADYYDILVTHKSKQFETSSFIQALL